MAFIFSELDEQTRKLMLDEIEHDQTHHILYTGKFLTEAGKAKWPELLLEAAKNHHEQWLATQIRNRGFLLESYTKKKPNGGYTNAKVPVTAPEMLAEGEFNRYYMRAICLKARENSEELVEICRAKVVAKPRPESEAIEGNPINAEGLLNDLRTNKADYVVFGLPPGPNSGLSIKRRQH